MMILTPLVTIITALIGWFDSKEKAVLLVLVMLVLFVAAAAWIAWRHIASARSLRAATRSVRDALARSDWTTADRLNAAEAALANNAVVGAAWTQYRATLREDPVRPGAYVNLVDPASWFAPGRLAGGEYAKWISTFANVFLCLGLLFTFVGLSAALLGVGETQTADAVQKAVNRILEVSSAKFITSIAGIVLYIILLLIGRWVNAAHYKATSRFSAEVQRLTTMITPEILLLDQLSAAREQTDRMKTLADDVAVAFEARLNSVVGTRLDAFPDALDKSIRPVVTAIAGMGSSLSKGADDALGRVAERLEAAAATMQAAQGGIGASGAAFGTEISRATSTMTESVTKMATAIDGKLEGLEGRIAQVTEALGQGASNIAGVSRGLTDATTTALTQALSTISAQAASGAEQARQQAQAAMHPLMESLRNLAQQIQERAAEGSGSLSEGGRSAAEAMSGAAEKITQTMTRLEAKIGGIDEALARGSTSLSTAGLDVGRATSAALEAALKTISDQAAQGAEDARRQSEAAMGPLMEGLRDLTRQIAEQAGAGRGHLVDGGKEAAGSLTTAAQQMGETLAAAVREASEKLQAAAGAMATRMDAAVGQFQALERAVAQHIGHLDATGRVITTAGQSFGTATTQLRLAAEPIQATLGSVEAAARKAVESLAAVDQVQTGVREATTVMQRSMTDAMTKLQSAAQASSAAFTGYQERFAATDDALGQTVDKLVNGTVNLGNAAATAINGMNAKMGEAVGSLRIGVEEIAESVSGLEDATAAVAKAMREHADEMKRLGRRP
jgi:hypothetical protein